MRRSGRFCAKAELTSELTMFHGEPPPSMPLADSRLPTLELLVTKTGEHLSLPITIEVPDYKLPRADIAFSMYYRPIANAKPVRTIPPAHICASTAAVLRPGAHSYRARGRPIRRPVRRHAGPGGSVLPRAQGARRRAGRPWCREYATCHPCLPGPIASPGRFHAGPRSTGT